jgi:putative endonuclease
MMPTDRRQRIGKLGEDAALAHLRRLGFGLVARRYRTRGGEIDLIVCDGETLVFVETKTRVARRPRIGLRANSVEWYSSRQARWMDRG